MWKNIIVLLLLFGACDREDDFPDIYVNKSIPITMAEYNNVYSNIWGYEFIEGGLGGIIIVQTLDGEFIAYDRSCTYETDPNCIVSGLNNDPILSCENCCNSQFLIIDGSVTSGEANKALKRYNTYFDGSILYITN